MLELVAYIGLAIRVGKTGYACHKRFPESKNIILYNLESKRDTISYILDMDGEIVIYRLIDDPQAMYRACVAQRSIMTGYGNNHKDWKDYANYLAWNYFRSADAFVWIG